MTNVHLAGDGDMYSGFGREDVAPALDTADLEFDSGFQVRVFTDIIISTESLTTWAEKRFIHISQERLVSSIISVMRPRPVEDMRLFRKCRLAILLPTLRNRV